MALAISFILILILAAVIITMENRIVALTKRVRVLEVPRLNDRLRNVEKALSLLNKKYND